MTEEPGVTEWRLQFGVFDGEAGALDLETKLERKGIKTHRYMAVWLASSGEEPMVVVSTMVFHDAAAARKASKRLKKKGIPSLARRFERHG